MLRLGEADVRAVWKLDRWNGQRPCAIGELTAALDTVQSLRCARQTKLRTRHDRVSGH